MEVLTAFYALPRTIYDDAEMIVLELHKII